MKNDRVNFGTKIGAILAAAGSAVGLGNIWRFPYETGKNGGAAFILLYLVCIVILGLPIMLSEFAIGRRTRSNTAGAYKVLVPGTAWRYVGLWGVLTGFFILGYYAVVAGWMTEYTWEAITNRFMGKSAADFQESFVAFSTSPIEPLIWLTVFLALTHFVIVQGVKSGIERWSKVLMPLLFLLIVVLVFCSLSLPNAHKGLEFLLKPDFSKVDSQVLFGAMGQAFFSLSLGMGCLSTYASYFSKENRLLHSEVCIMGIDTMIAILAGFIIFPAAFSVGISPDAGPSLICITLPNVFQQAFGSIPLLAYGCSLMFYTLLLLAAMTSAISMHEVVTAYIHEEFHLSRKVAACWVTGSCWVIALFCSLSLGVLQHITVFSLGFFDLLDFLTVKIMLPVGGMFIGIFTGWRLDKRVLRDELTNGGTVKFYGFKLLVFLLRFVSPTIIALIILNELGLLS